MKRVGHRKQQALTYIRRYAAGNGNTPTIMEIRNYLDLASTGSVHQILVNLEREGHIKRVPNIARGIRLVEHPINPS